MPEYLVAIIMLLILIPITIYAQKKYNKEKRITKLKDNPYLDLRAQALSVTPKTLQLNDFCERSPFGFIMEIGTEKGTATLVAYSDGNASIYFSSGSAVIGGFAHQNIRDVTTRLIKEASKYLHLMVVVKDYLQPINGNITFYALTEEAILTITEREKLIQDKSVEIWPLYYLAQDLITQLRKISGG